MFCIYLPTYLLTFVICYALLDLISAKDLLDWYLGLRYYLMICTVIHLKCFQDKKGTFENWIFVIFSKFFLTPLVVWNLEKQLFSGIFGINCENSIFESTLLLLKEQHWTIIKIEPYFMNPNFGQFFDKTNHFENYFVLFNTIFPDL
jgi:hypothetical protein